jgi:hypothetical protein
MNNSQETITKQELVTAFENSCVVNEIMSNFTQRLNAVKHQHQRNIWEIDSVSIGKMRIENVSGKCSITLFPKIYNTHNLKEKVIFGLTEQEYETLKKAYFGNIEYDEDYFESIDEQYSINK